MTISIFPRNGLGPGIDNSGVALTLTPVTGCEAVYLNETCAQRIDPRTLNGMISEIVGVINAGGLVYDCRVGTNLASAIWAMIGLGLAGSEIGSLHVVASAGTVKLTEGATVTAVTDGAVPGLTAISGASRVLTGGIYTVLAAYTDTTGNAGAGQTIHHLLRST